MQDWITAVSPLCEIIFKLTLIISLFSYLVAGVMAFTPIPVTAYISDGSALIAPRTPYIQETTQTTYNRIASEFDPITVAIGRSIISKESSWKSDAQNPISTAYGLFQFTNPTWEEQCKGEKTTENQIRCGLELLEKEQFYRWESSIDKWYPLLSPEAKARVDYRMVRCSCVRYVALTHRIPPMKTPADVSPNSPPFIGSLVLLNYNVSHIAVLTGFTADGFLIREANFNKCQETTRFVAWGDPFLRGFYLP